MKFDSCGLRIRHCLVYVKGLRIHRGSYEFRQEVCDASSCQRWTSNQKFRELKQHIQGWFRYLMCELALESTNPVPPEASVNICSKIVLFLLWGLSSGLDLMELMEWNMCFSLKLFWRVEVDRLSKQCCLIETCEPHMQFRSLQPH